MSEDPIRPTRSMCTAYAYASATSLRLRYGPIADITENVWNAGHSGAFPGHIFATAPNGIGMAHHTIFTRLTIVKGDKEKD